MRPSKLLLTVSLITACNDPAPAPQDGGTVVPTSGTPDLTPPSCASLGEASVVVAAAPEPIYQAALVQRGDEYGLHFSTGIKAGTFLRLSPLGQPLIDAVAAPGGPGAVLAPVSAGYVVLAPAEGGGATRALIQDGNAPQAQTFPAVPPWAAAACQAAECGLLTQDERFLRISADGKGLSSVRLGADFPRGGTVHAHAGGYDLAYHTVHGRVRAARLDPGGALVGTAHDVAFDADPNLPFHQVALAPPQDDALRLLYTARSADNARKSDALFCLARAAQPPTCAPLGRGVGWLDIGAALASGPGGNLGAAWSEASPASGYNDALRLARLNPSGAPLEGRLLVERDLTATASSRVLQIHWNAALQRYAVLWYDAPKQVLRLVPCAPG